MENIVSLFLFSGLAVWEDYHKREIPNPLICSALVSAFLYQIRQNGFHSIFSSFFQAFIIILILFPLFLFKMLGAGDLKLLGVTAVYLSWRRALLVFLSGIYLSLIPVLFLFFRREKCLGNKIPMSGPILGGIVLVLYREGFI